MLDALWDLVWAGEVTNDTFAPLRALRWKRPTGSRAAGPRRPRAGRLTALGPPEAAGRWSLVEPVEGVTPTERLHAQALAQLERHGVLTRDAVMAEASDGGFSGVYPVLRAMEEAGRIRRGYFVDGLGAAQFALAGALDRLRAVRDDAEGHGQATVHLLAAADPANPYGAALAWPRRGEDDRRPLQRAAGAYVVLVDGVAALYLERGGSTLQTLPAFDDPAVATAAVRGLATLVRSGRFRELVVRKADGEDIATAPARRGAARGGVRGRLPRPHPPRRALRSGHDARRRHAVPDGRGAAAVPRRPGRDRGARPGARGGPADPSRRRPAHRRGRGARQEPAHPLRWRPGAADPPADAGLVASLSTGRALAAAAGPGAARAGGPGVGRGLLRCPGRRAVRAAGGVAARCAVQARPGPARSRLRCRGGAAAVARPGPGGPRHRRGAARPAGAGGHRQRHQERGAVDRPGLPVRAGPRPRRRDTGAARRDRPAAAAGQRRPAPRPRAGHDRRRPRRARPALRLRPARPALPPLSHADPRGPAGHRPAPIDLLVSDLPGRGSGR